LFFFLLISNLFSGPAFPVAPEEHERVDLSWEFFYRFSKNTSLSKKIFPDKLPSDKFKGTEKLADKFLKKNSVLKRMSLSEGEKEKLKKIINEWYEKQCNILKDKKFQEKRSVGKKENKYSYTRLSNTGRAKLKTNCGKLVKEMKAVFEGEKAKRFQRGWDQVFKVNIKVMRLENKMNKLGKTIDSLWHHYALKSAPKAKKEIEQRINAVDKKYNEIHKDIEDAKKETEEKIKKIFKTAT